MHFRLLFALVLLCLGCGGERYRFVGPEDSVEKNRYMLAMEPIYAEGVELTNRLRRSVVKWAQQGDNPDWDVHETEFKTVAELIAAHRIRAGEIVPEKEDLEPVHSRYREGCSLCLDGIGVILTQIETRRQQGSYFDAIDLIDRGVSMIRGLPSSLERKRFLIR